jgi:hypothetical protein
MVAMVSLLVAIAGLVLYGLMSGKPSEVGLRMFTCGLLVFLLSAGQHSVKLF